jgi:hypothetical protein
MEKIMPTKEKYTDRVSKYFLGFAFFEYTIVAANLYWNPAFNLGQVGAVDPIIEGITNDEVFELYTSIPNERARRVTLWNLLFVRVGAIMQSAWGFAMMWSCIALPFKNRYPFHFIYCWVAFWMAHIDFSYGTGTEIGTNTLEKYGYEPMASRLNNMPFMVFLLLVHGSLATLSVLQMKKESNAADAEKIAPTEASDPVTRIENYVVEGP